MFDDVEFDDNLREQADKESLFKTSDLKYYLMALGFIGLGFFVIKTASKK